ncbi:MAG: Polyketide cyclase/dehydrase [Ramlibacter sp.]|jgi:hypothetical protein|nr:Polyketide cyclase/dehydrase [Ramlibacter sp.]
MHEIRTEIEIEASPARVWDVLLNFASHPQWNPFMRSISGKAVPGERLVVDIHPPGGRSMTFKPTVLVADPGRELRWLGRLLMPGVFDGEHFFQMEGLGLARTRLVHGEKFSGLLVPMVKSALNGGTRAGFIAMNKALKERAEKDA